MPSIQKMLVILNWLAGFAPLDACPSLYSPLLLGVKKGVHHGNKVRIIEINK